MKKLTEEIKNICDCSNCELCANCVHANSFRRYPSEYGGTGSCRKINEKQGGQLVLETLTKEQIDNYNLLFNTIETLRHSQGFYGRVFNTIINLSENELYDFILSLPKFKDNIDVILYFEQ